MTSTPPPSDPVERRLELSSGAGTLAALSWPRPGAPRLLALHGWLDNAASFIPMAPWLADYDLVALDLPGHGYSDWREAGAWYHYVDYLWPVLDALDALGWDHCHLLGHSLGGSLAISLAACQPERFTSVTSIEALGPISTPEDKILKNLRSALASRSQQGASNMRTFDTIEQATAARASKGGLSEPVARLLAERSVKAVPGGFQWRSDPRLRRHSLMRFSESQVLALLRGLDIPCRLILAQPATPFPDDALGQSRIDAAGCEVVRLPGHHHLHMETSEPVAREVHEFIQATGAPYGGDRKHESN